MIYLFAKILHDVFKKHAEIFGKTSAYLFWKRYADVLL